MPGMAAMEEVKNQVVGRVRGSSDASSIRSQEARKQNELKEMTRSHTNESVDNQDSRPLWQRVSLSVLLYIYIIFHVRLLTSSK
jgi:hypothetical protein